MEVSACVASTFEKMKWNAQGKGVNCRAFHFTSYRCVEECMTGFRIYGRTIKREQTCLHIGHLVPLERVNFAYVARIEQC